MIILPSFSVFTVYESLLHILYHLILETFTLLVRKLTLRKVRF